MTRGSRLRVPPWARLCSGGCGRWLSVNLSRPDDPVACEACAPLAGAEMRRPAFQSRSIRVALLRKRDGNLCGICGKPIDFRLPMNGKLKSAGPTMGPSVDHKVPRSAGGSDDWPNLQLAHGTCNQRKADSVTAN